jgi:uncharacterized protein
MDEIRLWRRLDLPGHEIARLARRDHGWELSGTAIFTDGGDPCRLDYVIKCDAAWHTRSAVVSGMIGPRVVDLRVAIDEGRWRVDEVEQPAVAGCIDIDLGFSPSTNLLPIRRLALPPGAHADVRAAWLPFPALVFEPLPQVYRREGARSYRYESGGGTFVRMLQVDDSGFVISYPGIWEAEVQQAATAPPPAPSTLLRDAEAVRAALIAAAVGAYEDAAMRGLCDEGAFEAAVSAMRHLTLENVSK